MKNILLAGGGTAGHVNPLLAVAEKTMQLYPENKIYALGTVEGLESRLVPERGIELLTIDRVPFPRSINKSTIAFPKKYSNNVAATVKIITDKKIDLVVGFGGYASAPAYAAARKTKTPFYIHEANAKPGLANRMFATSAKKVGTAFISTNIKNSQHIGMPLRKEIELLDTKDDALRKNAFDYFGLNPNKKTLLVTGGSQGAKSINLTVFSAAQDIINSGFQILHIWGELTETPVSLNDDYHIVKYCDKMNLAFICADFVISRSGASTVSEITALNIPALYVPYPHGNGEQKLNAYDSVSAGSSLVVEDKAFNKNYVNNVLLPVLLDDEKLAIMKRSGENIAIRDASDRMLRLMNKYL